MNIRMPIGLLLFAACPLALAQSTEPLVHEGVVAAPIETVWRAWTTSEGLRSWLAPHAEIDLSIGGKMRANYNPDGSLSDGDVIENTILAFDPQRMLSIRVSKAPDNFPFPDTIHEMWTVIYFEPSGVDETFVRVVAMGFTASEQSQAMRAFFERGNALTVREMQERIGRTTESSP